MKNKYSNAGKGDKDRVTNKKRYSKNWEKIFGKEKPVIKSRKETPSHASTQVHKDKTKVIPRKSKYKDQFTSLNSNELDSSKNVI